MRLGRTQILLLTLVLVVCVGLPVQANAAIHAYRELEPTIATEVREILIKHGMSIKQDRENRWFKIGSGSTQLIGGDPSFTLYFYQAHEIPLAAQAEVIDYCLRLYEATGRQNEIRIEMRAEKFEPTFFKPSPYFELHLKISRK